MLLLPEHVDGFFYYVKERQNILLKRRAGKAPPWTADPIIAGFRFCNVFREDDKVTTWYRENIRLPFENKKPGDLVFATIAMRLFNLETTVQKLLDAKLLTKWDTAKAKEAVAGLQPVVNAAYIVIGRPGMPKGEGICEILGHIWPQRHKLATAIMEANTIEQAVEFLADFERMGHFLGYEVATDLRHTHVLCNATDVMTWANPGPGAARGLSRMVGEHKKFFNRNSTADRVLMFGLMRELLALSKKDKHWPKKWQKWEMRDVEHALCEYDKYLRAKTGEGRPKQLYRTGV